MYIYIYIYLFIFLYIHVLFINCICYAILNDIVCNKTDYRWDTQHEGLSRVKAFHDGEAFDAGSTFDARTSSRCSTSSVGGNVRTFQTILVHFLPSINSYYYAPARQPRQSIASMLCVPVITSSYASKWGQPY